MLAYVRRFTYLSAAKNSNKEYLTYGKGKHKIWENHSLRRNLLRKQGFLCAFTWQSHQRHSWCPQFYLQRLPVGRDNISHVWRVPLWRRLRGRCQQKRVPSAGITWSQDTDEPHNRACHKPQTVIRPLKVLFYDCLRSFVFYKASFACFWFVIARYYSFKAKQNPLF